MNRTNGISKQSAANTGGRPGFVSPSGLGFGTYAGGSPGPATWRKSGTGDLGLLVFGFARDDLNFRD